ncbi:TolC family protein [Dyadobacter sp. 50-39]|uniref:TolC family protein n=1 Tax=Dyadobacter sp. 50-39 TaxID=1895756 RepID=UPI0025C1689B|nr:TolC family protein [Dyadobacter sp. 50-39]
MRTIVIHLGLAVAMALSVPALAQDSTRTLSGGQVLELVRKFHPVARQARIHVDKAQADLLVARGGFDPVLGAYVARKRFGGTEYYNRTSPEIVIPTWYGIEVYSGIDNYTGERLDPTMSKGQSSFIGASIPLAKDLLMDKRRAYLKQARIFTSMAETEQRLFVNDLLMEAMEAYWGWVSSYNLYQVMKTAVAINVERVDLVRRSFENGERAAIDTVEALAQLQSIQYQETQYRMQFRNAGLTLSSFLWTDSGAPYNLPEDVSPPAGWDNQLVLADMELDLNALLTIAENSHPALRVYDYKLRALDVEKKLKFQGLLPKADFRYNHLSKGYNAFAGIAESSALGNNYQYGFKFEIPLRLSAGRGEYRKAGLKIMETRLDQAQKQLDLQVKIRQYHNEYTVLKEQIGLQSLNFSNYQKLLEAEQTRLGNGESSLFLVNSRETKLLEAQQKLIELKAKFFKTAYAVQWTAGLLN